MARKEDARVTQLLWQERRIIKMKQNDTVKKLALAGVLTAVAVVGSFISFPDTLKQCATGTAYGKNAGVVVLWTMVGVGIAFAVSLIRNS